MSSPRPVALGVTPSPITASDSSLQGSPLQVDLRTRALQRCLGGQSYSSILPEIQRRLGEDSTVNAEDVQLRTHTTPEELERAFSGIRSHIRMQNGVVGEFNQIVTFSLPVSAGDLTLRGYYFDRPERPTSGWNSNSSFTPGNTHSMRFHNLYEVHVRREGDRYVYTVALTHGFVGGLQVGTGNGTILIRSHTFPQSVPTPTPRPLVRAETPNPDAIVQGVSLPELGNDGDAAPPPPPSSTVVANSGQQSGGERRDRPVAGFQPRVGDLTGGPPTVLAALVDTSPELPEESTLPGPLPLQSNVGGSDRRDQQGSGGGTAVAGATPRTGSGGNEQAVAAAPTLPELPASEDRPGGAVASSVPASGGLPLLTEQPGVFAGFVQPRLGMLPPPRPRVTTQSAGNLEATQVQLPPLNDAGEGGTTSPLRGPISGSSGSGPLPVLVASPSGSTPGVDRAAPAVVIRARYNAPRFVLPSTLSHTLDPNDDNRRRAHALSVLALFTIRPMADMTSGSDLPNTAAGNSFRDNILDACYYFPETAFGDLQRFINGARPEDRDPLESLSSLTEALLGTGSTQPPRGSSVRVETRISEMRAFLNENPRLPADQIRDIREVRTRLLSMTRALYWSAQFMDETQQQAARNNGENPETLLDAEIRPSTHHRITRVVRDSFQDIFGATPIATRHMWAGRMAALRTLEPDQLESVANFGSHDVLALRTFIARARQTRRDPAFQANFANSRRDILIPQLVPLLRAGEGGNVAEAPIETRLIMLFGETNYRANRDQILRSIRSLNGDNTPDRQRAVAAQILEPFATQLTFGDTQLTDLDRTIDRLELFTNRVRLLLRAQTVSDNTDRAVGEFLLLLPDVHGTPATGNPTNADFEARLTTALNAIESEYAMLGGDAVGGAYASSRRAVLTFMLQDLRRHLVENDSRWGAFLEGNAGRDALRRRVDRAAPAARTAATLPPDHIEQVEAFAELLSNGYRGFMGSDTGRALRGFFSGLRP